MIKKIFTLFMLLAFCTTSTVLAADPQAVSLTKSDTFDNNYQSLNNANSVSAPLSTIEKMYNGKENAVSKNILYQVGYNQFNTTSSNRNITTGKYDSSYKLSIGEKVNVLSFGESVDVMALSGSNLVSPMTQAEVGSNGALFIPGIGMVKAENRTLGDVEQEINGIASKKYTNMKIRLQIPSGNEFSVFVYGEVNRPGKVYIGSNSSVLDALSAAGGVKKTGTLRNIKYNGKQIDLYDTLFLGDDNGITVKANDKIFVEKIGSTVAIKNGVTIPGIYEIKNGEMIEDIIKYAGGLLVTTSQDDITMVSFDKRLKQKFAKNIKWDLAQTTKLSNGDAIEFKETYNNVENTVTIQGNIKHPATYAYKEGMRLSDILKSEHELLEETFINQAVIRRISGYNNTIETIPVFLKEFFAGMNDPILMPRDVITIYKSTNSKFIDVYGCINTPKHMPYKAGMTLDDLMTDIKFMESDVERNDDDIFDSAKSGENVQFSAGTNNTNKLIPTEKVAVEITNKSGDTQVYYMYDIMINSDRIRYITINPEDKIFFRTLRDNETMKTIKISGFVKQPGVQTFVKGMKLVDVIKQAGGLDDEADLRGIVFRRNNLKNKQTDIARKNNERDIKLLEGRLAAGYKQSQSDQESKMNMIEQLRSAQGTIGNQYNGQIALNIKSNNLNKISNIDNIELQDGDDIYIPRISNYVVVMGEVYNEQSFIYKNGTNVKNYIKQVGGYTQNANRFRIYKVGVNGKAEKVHMGTRVASGDIIVVPRKIAGNDWLTPICQAVQGLGQIALVGLAIKRW